MIDRQRRLVWFLRLYAAILLPALPAALLPTSWLAASYQWLRLGEWPRDVALLEYLARSASGVYALIGGMALLMSFDVRRYRPLIRLLGFVSLPGSVYLAVIGVSAGMPWWWIAVESPIVLLTGVFMLTLSQSIGRSS